jgi:hypothetical protein
MSNSTLLKELFFKPSEINPSFGSHQAGDSRRQVCAGIMLLVPLHSTVSVLTSPLGTHTILRLPIVAIWCGLDLVITVVGLV